ncbi:MAG: M56 family metallopeptidase [Phycisphaerales bacterium]
MNDLARLSSSLGDAMVGWFAWMNAATAMLAAAAFVLDRVLARRVAARWRLAFHAAVFARLLVPIGATIAVPTGAPASIPDRVARIGPDDRDASLVGAASLTLAASDGSPWRSAALVPLLYLAGVAHLALRWRRDAQALRALRAAATPVALAASVPVEAHPDAGPVLVGIRRPVLIVPRSLLAPGARDSLRSVLAHEEAHVARRDPITATILHALVVLMWPVVPLWFAASRCRALMELACDERAVAGRTMEERREYGRAIVELAAHRRAALPALSFGGGVRERIAALAAVRRWRMPVQATASLALATALVACSTAKPAPAAGSAAAPEASTMAPTGPQGAHVPGPAESAPFDPLGGDYPQVFWMCNIFEVPGPVEIRADGTVAATSNPKAGADAVIEGDRVTACFDSLEKIDGARLVAAPAILAKFDENASISMGETDKAHQAVGARSISVNARNSKAGVVATIEAQAGAGGASVSRRIADRLVPSGSALVLAVPGPQVADPWMVVMVRPKVLNSVAEYPFQTAGPLN